ncbi:hypothetical protein KGA66_20100 [Actinocrinis puniceicyclus]|uniref:Protein kinase domain-containing protein n=1 Tax=Actinocrinis puniceicyclus TaxID=977794 RepID=A0A8J8BG40_9ACTN|nr:hypothetical protein [Actinocrinis puniceicyclus]MBS2965364.1 hypothetical protein [Actinocrinis puniceicyclus]
MKTLERGGLVLGDRLGQGGQGAVYPVLNVKAGGALDAVYKEYRVEVRDQVDVAALEEMVDTAARLAPDDRLWLGEHASWPTQLVSDGGAVCGFLMRAVPPEFSFALRTLSGTQQGKPRLAQVEFLLNDDDYVAGIGLTVSERDRFALLLDLAATLVRLHGFEVAVGDLSPKNLLFAAAAPGMRCFLIDCDAMRVAGRDVLPQVETTEWELPQGEAPATASGDAYKFALLASRLFARDQSSRDPSRLTAAAPAVGELAHLTLERAPGQRPALAAWLAPLEAAARMASEDPAQQTIALGPVPPRAPFPQSPRPNAARPPSGARRVGALATLAAAVLGLGITLAVVNGNSSGSSGAANGYSQNSGQSSDTSGGQNTSPTDSPSPSPSDTSGESAQLRAFVSILSDTASARSAVGNAVNGVGACTQDPASGISTLQSSARSRTDDAQAAGQLPVDAIPGGESLRSTLVSLLQDSASADSGYAQWMQDIASQGCPVDTSSDQGYQSGDQASQTATQDKQNFVAQWNPLAAQFGLPTYTADQL